MRKKKVEEVKEPIIKEIVVPKIEVPEFYILKIGETLTDVAKKFNIDEKKLKEMNGEVVGTNQIRVK